MIFKREKEVARKLEFDGLYVTRQAPEEDIKGQWDRLVINTPYVQKHMINWTDVCFTINISVIHSNSERLFIYCLSFQILSK